VTNPYNDEIFLQVEDDESSQIIGTANVSIAQLLKEDNMTVDRIYNMSCLKSGYSPKINIKIQLKILKQLNYNDEEVF
jgi:hypothetical protein